MTCEPRKMGTITLDVAMFKLGLEGYFTTQRPPWSFNKVGPRRSFSFTRSVFIHIATSPLPLFRPDIASCYYEGTWRRPGKFRLALVRVVGYAPLRCVTWAGTPPGRVASGWPVYWLSRRSLVKLDKLSGATRPHLVT